MTVLRRVTVEKAAGGDDLEFVLSDETKDRMGDIIDPKGWVLSNFKKNPIALFNHDSKFPIGRWENVRVEGGKLIGRLKLAAQGTSDRVNEVIKLVEQGILRAVSVGFIPLKSEPLDEEKPWAGLRFLRQELLETSLVSVPANPAALQLAKSMHVSAETMSLVFGKSASEGEAGTARHSTGKPAATSPDQRAGKMNIPLSKRIEDAQNEINRLKDILTAEVGKDEPDQAVIDEATSKIEAKEAEHASLKRAETALAAKTAQQDDFRPTSAAPAIAGRRPFNLPAKQAKPSDFIFRAASVHAVAFATGKDIDAVLSRMYADDEGTGIVVKAAVSGATTTTSGWAAELVNTVMTDFLETLRPFSVYPALAAAGGGRLAFGPNQGAIKIPSRASTPSIGGSFVGEGAPIPVRRLGLASITLSPKKMGVISVFSREMARYGTPAIEALVRQEIIADTAITVDSLLLDSTAGSSVRPAGLLNGVTGLTPTAGGGSAAVLGDIRKLRAPFDAANASRNLMLLMNPAQAEGLNLTPGPDGTLGWSDSIMNRYRVAVSTAIPAARVIMIGAEDFVSATGDVPEFDLSDQAVLHMEDTTPLQIGTTGAPNTVAAPVQSMFQTAQIAVRMLMDISWAMRRTGMVQYIDAVTW